MENKKPVVIKDLGALLAMHEKQKVAGGDLLVDRQGTKFIVMAEDKVWNTYPHLMVNPRNGRISAMSDLKFPITWEG